jgi:hypothetical protein
MLHARNGAKIDLNPGLVGDGVDANELLGKFHRGGGRGHKYSPLENEC